MKRTLTLEALAERLGGVVVGDPSYVVDRVVSPKKLRKGAVACLWDSVVSSSTERERSSFPKPVAGDSSSFSSQMEFASEGACFVAAPDFFVCYPDLEGVAVENPRKIFPLLLSLFVRNPHGFQKGSSPEVTNERRGTAPGIHPTSVVSPEAFVHPSAWIGPLCVIEAGARVEEGAFLRSQVFVGEESVVGPGTVVEPGAVLLENVSVGRSCLIHSCAVLGCDGFGVDPSATGGIPEKIPQLGGVVVEDEVEIGACTTVDRGTLDDTVIGNGTKIDNHVHVAHNVRIGKNCIIVAMAGLAGSAVLEDSVIMAARSGVKEHTRIGKGATVAAQGGAIKDVPPGAIVSGFPARPHRENFRVQAALQRLPEMISRVKELEKRLDALASKEVSASNNSVSQDFPLERSRERAARDQREGSALVE